MNEISLFVSKFVGPEELNIFYARVFEQYITEQNFKQYVLQG